jgi:hypothetical protein
METVTKIGNIGQSVRYRFIEDPGHGWLEVPIEQIKAFGIEGKISGYSYKRNGMAYLEEDCDAGLFINAYKEQVGPWSASENVIPVYQENTPIRGYLRF